MTDSFYAPFVFLQSKTWKFKYRTAMFGQWKCRCGPQKSSQPQGFFGKYPTLPHTGAVCLLQGWALSRGLHFFLKESGPWAPQQTLPLNPIRTNTGCLLSNISSWNTVHTVPLHSVLFFCLFSLWKIVEMSIWLVRKLKHVVCRKPLDQVLLFSHMKSGM